MLAMNVPKISNRSVFLECGAKMQQRKYYDIQKEDGWNVECKIHNRSSQIGKVVTGEDLSVDNNKQMEFSTSVGMTRGQRPIRVVVFVILDATSV